LFPNPRDVRLSFIRRPSGVFFSADYFRFLKNVLAVFPPQSVSPLSCHLTLFTLSHPCLMNVVSTARPLQCSFFFFGPQGVCLRHFSLFTLPFALHLLIPNLGFSLSFTYRFAPQLTTPPSLCPLFIRSIRFFPKYYRLHFCP